MPLRSSDPIPQSLRLSRLGDPRVYPGSFSLTSTPQLDAENFRITDELVPDSEQDAGLWVAQMCKDPRRWRKALAELTPRWTPRYRAADFEQMYKKYAGNVPGRRLRQLLRRPDVPAQPKSQKRQPFPLKLGILLAAFWLVSLATAVIVLYLNR